MLTTTFALLKQHHACQERYKHLAKALGGIKGYGEDTPITLLQILDINGFSDALWSLGAMQPQDEAKYFTIHLACDFGEHLLPIYEAKHSGGWPIRDIFKTLRRYPDITEEEAHVQEAEPDAWADWAAAIVTEREWQIMHLRKLLMT